jgi:transcriptional regulator with XRE-family HTH domain
VAWSDNVKRLMAVHLLTGQEAAKLFRVSPQAVSEWISATREEPRDPNLQTLLRVAAVFEVDATKLVQSDFVDLLPEIADAERFERVERKAAAVRRRRARVSVVDPQDAGRVRPIRSSKSGQAKGSAVSDKRRPRGVDKTKGD